MDKELMADADDDDRALLDAWRGGDLAAGNRLFERHFDALYRFFDGKAGGEVADLVQRTFLALVEGRERFRGESTVRTFLFAIARHEVHQHWRAKRRDAQLDFGVSSLLDLNPSPSSLLGRAEAGRALYAALEAIPLDLQIALELHYWEDQSGPALAVILGIPEGTVRSRLRRGIEALRQKLGPADERTHGGLEALLRAARPEAEPVP